ncbi:MAG: cupin domain-containing protein [Rhodospirillales bacterium]|nr:MAG: cupin domain-containing protein [Rhodospirillales bacterium]
MPSIQPIHRPQGATRHVGLLGDRYIFRLTSEDTDGAFALVEAIVGPGHGTPPHVHTREDETFVILEGRIEFTVGDRTLTLAIGDTLFAPREVAHHFRNPTERPARMLSLITPGGFEAFLERAGTRLAGPDDAPPPPGDQDIARVMALADDYGVKILSPG